MEITSKNSLGDPNTKLGFDKSKVMCFKCGKEGISNGNAQTSRLTINSNLFGSHSDY
ncbi:hypothetical protein Hanom_Chr07g00628021 [Helianthus anomalus]